MSSWSVCSTLRESEKNIVLTSVHYGHNPFTCFIIKPHCTPCNHLCDAGSVKQLKAIQREELGQDFDVLYMRLAVTAAIVLLGPVQPRSHISAQVTVVEAAHLEGVQENSQCGQ